MKTTEIILPPQKFKSLSTMPYGRYYDLHQDAEDNVDIVASTLVIDENNEIFARIIGEKATCPIQQRGNGCHIRDFEYPQNTPVLTDMLSGFEKGVKYRTDDIQEGITYRYEYLWFEKPLLENSALVSYFGAQSKIVFFDGDFIYIIPISYN